MRRTVEFWIRFVFSLSWTPTGWMLFPVGKVRREVGSAIGLTAGQRRKENTRFAKVRCILSWEHDHESALSPPNSTARLDTAQGTRENFMV